MGSNSKKKRKKLMEKGIGLIRIGRPYEPHEIFDNICDATTKSNKRVDFDGDFIKMGSLRYQVFSKGLACAHCGIVGKYFYKEKPTENTQSYHFNLYAINDLGEEVLMTKDHIHPKSKGGKDYIDNLITMCSRCNEMKAHVIGPLTPHLLLSVADLISDENKIDALKKGAVMLKQFQSALDCFEAIDGYLKTKDEPQAESLRVRIKSVIGFDKLK